MWVGQGAVGGVDNISCCYGQFHERSRLCRRCIDKGPKSSAHVPMDILTRGSQSTEDEQKPIGMRVQVGNEDKESLPVRGRSRTKH